ncbi:MAG: hypothetical protein U9Q30_07400 [Campylobacterota bacterium]|nr:hypothetical protein [Campylobacterota bacterium]
MTHTQIENYFIDIKGINEAKKIYKKLAKLLHPDMDDGDTESFKLLNNIYNDIIENKIYFSDDTKFDIELEKIISQILHYENIIIEVVGSWIWLSGDTKIIKDKLKELNFRWAKNKKMWYFGEKIKNGGKTKSMEDIKSKYGCQTVKTKEKGKLTA